MSYQYPEIKKFSGLYLQANSFSVPDGGMEDAFNLVVQSDDIISKVRGNYEYFEESGSQLNKLVTYQDTLVAICNNKVSYFTDTGTAPNLVGNETDLTGETVSVTSPRVSRTALAGNNLYFTTDNGIYKLDAFNSKVYKAGSPPGIDLSVTLMPFNGPLPDDSQVGYRVLFGRRDSNQNLILGAPSDTFIVVNAAVEGVSYTSSGGGPYTVTVTSPNHGLATGMSIIVQNATVPALDTTHTITVVNANTFTFSSAVNPLTGTLDYANSRRSLIEASVPSEINDPADAYFYQVYRTTPSINADTVPSPDFKLVTEQTLTATEIANHVFFFEDDVDEILLGAELYTNPNSREGELQANYKPPLALDIGLFKDYMLYFNCATRQALNVDIIDTTVIANNDYVELKVDATTRRYTFHTGVANRTVNAESVSGTGTVTITYTSHGFANGYTVFIAEVTGTVPEGLYTISGVTANTFDITAGITEFATALNFQGVSNGTNNIVGFDKTNISIAVQLRTTAQLLVKAINRDDLSPVYAKYISGVDDIPGKMSFSGKDFTDPIYMRASSSTVGDGFNPTLPDSFSTGTQVFSTNDAQPHTVYSSKLGEFEAVPPVNFLTVGSKNKAIIRGFALRDSVIILKEDGVFRLTGDDPTNFTVTALDTTVIIKASSSADVLNNQVIALTNQGVCLITESSVQIVSRKIDDLIQPILGSTSLETSTGAVAYESERLYILTTLSPNSSSASVTYLYNILNDTWTTYEPLIDQGVIGPNNILYFINLTNRIQKERKTQSKLDFCGQNFSTTVTSVATDTLSAVINSPDATPAFGDVLVKNNVFSRILSVTGSTPNYTVQFARPSNILAADSLQLYKAYTTRVKMSPFHAGQVGLMKQFSQFQIHLREESISRINISFSGYTFGGSEETMWTEPALLGTESLNGWGFDYWGFFPWGEEDSIIIVPGTRPAPPIRIYVPIFQQRTTFIQAILVHSQAGEQMNIQAMSWAVRDYKERVSK